MSDKGEEMSFEIQKFPDLEYQGRRLIWDSRQVPDGRPEWVICPQDQYSNPEIESQLRARLHSKRVGPIGSGADLEVKNVRDFLGEAASLALGNPSQQMTICGVTGTNGKTTSTLLVSALIQSGINGAVAEIGTLGLRIFRNGKLEEHVETGFTTPEAPTLHRMLFDLQQRGVKAVVMEVSSHALELGRVSGVDFDGGLFTNLSQDHLDFHKSMQAYEAAKSKLFTKVLGIRSFENVTELKASVKNRVCVINSKDPAGLRMMAQLPLGLKSFAFSRDRTFQILKHDLNGMKIGLDGEELETRLVGDFNAENVVGSVLLVRGLGLAASENIKNALLKFTGARGRLEKVTTQGGLSNPKKMRHVFVDYAHTPDALEKALATLSKLKQQSAKLCVVFGCGGDRDRTKRPLMGRIAQAGADLVYVTSDNPRTENPDQILKDIVAGMSSDHSNVEVIEDREEAIRHCLSKMSVEDICLIAGKGHEEYQIIGTQKIDFSDFKVVEEWLAE